MARWPAPRSTFSLKNRPRTMTCSGLLASFAHRIWARPPTRRKSMSRSRSPSKWRIICCSAALPTRLTCRRCRPRKRRGSNRTWRWRRSSGGGGQIAGTEVRGIDIEVEGAAAELNIKPITGAVLAGLMGTYSDTVNMVNAPYLARERGLDVREIRHDREGDYHTLLAVTVRTAEGTRRVAGTLFGNRAARLVNIFGVPVEAELTGQMIYIVNTDEPAHRRARHRVGRGAGEYRHFNLGRRKAAGRRRIGRVDDPITPNWRAHCAVAQ